VPVNQVRVVLENHLHLVDTKHMFGSCRWDRHCSQSASISTSPRTLYREICRFGAVIVAVNASLMVLPLLQEGPTYTTCFTASLVVVVFFFAVPLHPRNSSIIVLVTTCPRHPSRPPAFKVVRTCDPIHRTGLRKSQQKSSFSMINTYTTCSRVARSCMIPPEASSSILRPVFGQVAEKLQSSQPYCSHLEERRTPILLADESPFFNVEGIVVVVNWEWTFIPHKR
jgi:hypothetical protein